MSRLGDILVEHGPIAQDYVASPGLSSDMRWIRADEINELREELMAARAAAALGERFEVDATPWRDAEGANLMISCRRCPWYADIEYAVGVHDATALAELNRRAGEHAEACR